MTGIEHLRAAGVSIVLDTTGPRLPRVLHWGADLGAPSADDLAALARTSVPPVVSNGLDVPAPVSVLPEPATGWQGLPGLAGHRDGRDAAPVFDTTAVTTAGRTVLVEARDVPVALGLRLTIQLTDEGVLRLQAAVRNDGAAPYTVDAALLALPVPPTATEILDLTGRHCRERAPQRTPFTYGTRVRDGRRGRTGTDATLLLAAGTAGFGFGTGKVWACHVAWSGNHRTFAERHPVSGGFIGGGELLTPGEVRLAPGEEYVGPWLYGVYGQGIDEVSARLHEHLRARPHHPSPERPRPVVLNTWEAVYFDHDLDRLTGLADTAAELGVERFVLDDGWFAGRRDDNAGLGDWVVDPVVWPDGLHPLVDHVRGLGMEFGLWVEPEMVNPDSDLARAHPDWILGSGPRLPPLSRRQQVVNLAEPGAYRHVADQLLTILREHDIGYLKWDHNRDLVGAGAHAQTLATYRLMDELRAARPGLEIESCSSGGGRVDLGVLEHTDRVWASDTNDALERQSIQRWTQLLLPPELVGAHVGPTRAHTTGRTHDLSFRAGTALFGHFGVEWDVTTATDDERAELARWIATYKTHRRLLHTGRVVRSDHPDPTLWVHGVVATDGSEAVYAVVAVASGTSAPNGRVTLPGLVAEQAYDVFPLHVDPVTRHDELVPWLADGGTRLSGALLGTVGVQAPTLQPEHLLLLHVVAT